MISLVVYGKPQPAGSKTVGFAKNGHHFVRDSAKGSAEWKRTVAQVAGAEMVGHPLLDGPLALRVTFVLPRPKSHFGVRGLRPSSPSHPTVKPDVTKLLRAVEDALTGIVWRDDAQVVIQTAQKMYGERTRCEIRVARVGEPVEIGATAASAEGGGIQNTSGVAP